MIRKILNILLCIMLVLATAACKPTYDTEVTFENKFNNEFIEMCGDREDYGSLPIVVWFGFKNNFKCDCTDEPGACPDPENKHGKPYYLETTREDTRQYFEKLGLKDILMDPVCHQYFGACAYESYDLFMAGDYKILQESNPKYLTYVLVQYNAPPVAPANLTSGGSDLYPLADVLSDIGVPENVMYDASDIKIGILDTGVPYDRIEIPSVQYWDFNSEVNGEHSYGSYMAISKVLDRTDIANIYFAGANSYYATIELLDWLVIDKSVDVINMSLGFSDWHGKYGILDAYVDYLIRMYGCIIVCSAGNESNKPGSEYVLSPAKALNTISVACVNSQHKVAVWTSDTLESPWTILESPSISAPGVRLSGVYGSEISGTSIAAPFVTGIIAMLLDEFSTLKDNPERIKALLSSTATDVDGQTTIYDVNSGYGLVNYTNARSQFGNIVSFGISESDRIDTLLKNMSIYVPAGQYMDIVVSSLYLGPLVDPSSDSDDYNKVFGTTDTRFTRFRISTTNISTGVSLDGLCTMNNSYVRIHNTSSSGVAYVVQVYTNEPHDALDAESLALSYHIYSESLACSHQNILSYVLPNNNSSTHNAYCECGEVISESHTLEQNGNVLTCIHCPYSIMLARYLEMQEVLSEQ